MIVVVFDATQSSFSSSLSVNDNKAFDSIFDSLSFVWLASDEHIVSWSSSEVIGSTINGRIILSSIDPIMKPITINVRHVKRKFWMRLLCLSITVYNYY